MDLPYQKNNEFIQKLQQTEKAEYKDAVRRDYEVNWKELRKSFQLMTRCMTSMIERIMKPIYTKDCWKILIECVSECPETGYKNLLGVYSIQVLFDRDQFFGACDLDKKKMVIAVVQLALEQISDCVEFDVANINDACLQIVKKEYLNEWIWRKAYSREKREAKIKIVHDVNDVKLYVVFSEESIEKLLLCTAPDERSYGVYLGEFHWISEEETALITQDGDMYVATMHGGI